MHQFYLLCSQLIGGIVVCLLIISFSVTLTLNFRPLYYADIQNLHITELSGRIHFEEVKKIFDFFGWLFVGTLLLTAAAAFYFIKKHAWLWLRIAGILCIALPAFLGLMVAVNWDYVFITFHQLVFNNDYWLFDSSTDPIIDILPDEYFMHCAIMIFVLIFVGSFLCFIFSHYIKRRSG